MRWSWRDSESAVCPRIATSEWCWTATDQRHQHLCCEYLPNASYGDRADLLVGQLQLQLTARGAGIVAGLVRTERAAPALEITALVGSERCHADYPCAVGEDQGCRTRVGRHSHDGSGTDRVVAPGGSDLNVAARPGAAVAAGHERPQLGMTARSTAYPDVREPYALKHQRCGRLSSRVCGCTGRLKLGPGQVQASWERCCQYPWAGSARSPRAARCAGARLSVAAARVAASGPVVAAPGRTASTHGWCSTAARATASGVAASSSAAVRSATGMPDSRPASRAHLRVEGLDAVVFALVPVGVGPPAGRVGVAPLAADHDIVDAGTAVQPVGEELLGEAIRASHVEVAHAAGVPHVEELVGPLAQRVHDRSGGRSAACPTLM